MPTQKEYREKIQPLLSEAFSRQTLAAPSETTTSLSDKEFLDNLSDTLSEILVELERQHLGASTHVESLMAAKSSDPWPGHSHDAFLLYYLKNTPSKLREEIDALPELKAVWDAMAQVAAPPVFTPSSLESLSSALSDDVRVKCNKWGSIYGTGKYEIFDPGWAWTLKNNLMNHLPKWRKGYGVADFIQHDWQQPVAMKSGSDGKVRIALLGDFGSGKYKLSGLAGIDGPACAVMDTLRSLPVLPDYLCHLGDTYYSGTGPNRSPKGEELENFLEILKGYPELVKPGNCFALNSNHEMYGGAHGYYSVLSDPLFSGQKGCSYFTLEFVDWVVVGIDSAYFDPSALYMNGGLGDRNENPQYQFLEQIKATGKKVIILSHHNGLDTDGEGPSKYLWNDVTKVLTPDYWYWGHTHLGIFYNAEAYSGDIKTRCIGHSSMPFAIPPGMEKNDKNVDWYSTTPLVSDGISQALSYSRPRAKNGFAILTLSENGITEEVYEIGNTEPVWRS
jgi:hypothetical protein